MKISIHEYESYPEYTAYTGEDIDEDGQTFEITDEQWAWIQKVEAESIEVHRFLKNLYLHGG